MRSCRTLTDEDNLRNMTVNDGLASGTPTTFDSYYPPRTYGVRFAWKMVSENRGLQMADWHIRSIFHFILPCTNVERSTAFYAHFGFEVIKDNRNVPWPDTSAATSTW
jgi:hypothetical protein